MCTNSSALFEQHKLDKVQLTRFEQPRGLHRRQPTHCHATVISLSLLNAIIADVTSLID